MAFADEPPPVDAAELVTRNPADAVITLGDLQPAWIASLQTLELPRLGVHGNHDGEHDLPGLGIRDLHLSRAEVGGWSFAGFEGCVRYGDGPHQFTQEEATVLARRLPPADVLLSHCPPWGVNDEPDDPAHAGFVALREWVERHQPRMCCTGTRRPTHAREPADLRETEVVWVRGAVPIDLKKVAA